MEEQLLFTRIHDALDIQTPPGAYERLRSQLTKKPVRQWRWPALQTRWSNMGFRFAAGLAIVAIAVAAGVAALAIHNSTNNTAPAAPRMSVQAYQKMVADDNANASVTYSAPCGSGNNSGCGADATRGIPAVQKWIDDISRPDIPTRFVIINAEMREHLIQNIAAQRDLLAASSNHDGLGMDRALWIAVYAAGWTSTILPDIAQSRSVDATTYVRLVAHEVITLNACGPACGFTGDTTTCMQQAAPALSCQSLFDSGMGPTWAGFAGDLVKEAAPPSLAAKDIQLQSDLAQADATLITIRVAIAANDQAAFNLGLQKLVQIKTQVVVDSAKITG